MQPINGHFDSFVSGENWTNSKSEEKKTVRSVTPAEVPATWADSTARLLLQSLRLHAKLMRWFYDVFGSNRLWPGLKRYVSQPAWHFNQSSQLLFSISVLIINMLLLFLNISPCWLNLKDFKQATADWKLKDGSWWPVVSWRYHHKFSFNILCKSNQAFLVSFSEAPSLSYCVECSPTDVAYTYWSSHKSILSLCERCKDKCSWLKNKYSVWAPSSVSIHFFSPSFSTKVSC